MKTNLTLTCQCILFLDTQINLYIYIYKIHEQVDKLMVMGIESLGPQSKVFKKVGEVSIYIVDIDRNIYIPS